MALVNNMLFRFIYRPPPSLFISAISVISFASLANAGFVEIKGKHLQYAKFWNVGDDLNKSSRDSKPKVSGRIGMIILYAPAFLAGLASFFLLPDEGFRFALVRSVLTIHFFKRLLEHLSRGIPEPAIDLKYAGIGLFLLGIGGNFYHHVLLSKLRSDGEKLYKIPQGGLFGWVICPHYLFEILGFIGISCISQTLYSFSFTIGTAFYLMGRSYATWKWYQSKFDDFPKNVKALVPYIF